MSSGAEYLRRVADSLSKDDVLSRREKALILMCVDAVLYREQSMLEHTKIAMDSGATAAEIADLFMAGVITRGLTIWLTGVKALEYARTREKDNPAEESPEKLQLMDIAQSREYLSGENGNLSNWACLLEEYSPVGLVAYSNLRRELLRDAAVTRRLKELAIIALNVALGYRTGLTVHIDAALKEGATPEQIEKAMQLALVR